MVTQLLIQKILQFLIIMILGFLLVKIKLVKSEDSKILSKLTLYLLIPANILKAYQIDYNSTILRNLGLAVLVSVVIHLVLLGLVKLFEQKLHLTEVEKASIIYSNAGNLVIPLVAYILGDEWVIYSTAFISVQLCFLWTHGLSLFQKPEGGAWKRIFGSVNIVTVMVAAACMLLRIHFPTVIYETLDSVSAMAGPVSMLVTGMIAAGADLKQLFKNKRMYLTTALRLLAVPALILAGLKACMAVGLFPEGSYVLLIVFLATITPAASTVVQFAQLHDKDPEYAGAINIATSVGSMVTMPLFVWLYLL